MLYRTHHHPLLITTLPHYPSSPLSPPPHLILSSSPSLPLQKMECVQETLKTGVNSETAPFEEDDFFVDELLDFSNGFSETEDQSPELKEPEVGEPEPDRKRACSVFQESEKEPAKDEFVSLPESEISVPVEGLESLEWLSHFVEDSFSDYSLTEKLPPKPAENLSEPAAPVHESPCFATPVQTKARTKRARTGVRVWPVLSPESSTSSSSSTSSITVESFFGKPTVKKLKKKSPESAAGGGGGAAAAQPRRCSHCGVTKTPQWRAGPLGSKTLCNACGVRYKSGRLLPEYRPACSPTFSTDLHSNNHRKVLEMRRKKEVEVETTVPPPPVRSF